MFTINQIRDTHSKVKSGADFPKYIQDMKKLGVIAYEHFVSDGHTLYYGSNGFTIQAAAKYETLHVEGEINYDQFKKDLQAHQQGKTTYPNFCSDCAKSGIEKWVIDIPAMTCTYYGKAGTEIVVETIPTI
ncbi:MAG TPA: DUF1398 family protein [Ferruginibacter sp.]|jgi:uncharacterized protein YbcV (DUF1398 family)|nr:DUF1398 family protein [Ferruginibacter sp.]